MTNLARTLKPTPMLDTASRRCASALGMGGTVIWERVEEDA